MPDGNRLDDKRPHGWRMAGGLGAIAEHFAFVAAMGNDRQMVIVDGTAGPVLQNLSLKGTQRNDEWLFSADGTHFAYTGDNAEKKKVLVFDGKPLATTKGEFVAWAFSPDSRRFAYVEAQDEDGKEAAHVVLDGKAERTYEQIVNLQFSPDSQRHAYKASQGK